MDPSQNHPETADTPQVLLEHHLNALRLPSILREYDEGGAAVLPPTALITRATCCAITEFRHARNRGAHRRDSSPARVGITSMTLSEIL